jgi:pyruvate ferredoxin oxidoreductase gamma subunit
LYDSRGIGVNVPKIEGKPVPEAFGMRFESVGGLGANLAGQVMAEALVLSGMFNGAHFSSYGSEKKGAPVKSFVRLCAPDKDVRENSPVESPELLAVFHQCLLRVTGTLSGFKPDSTLVVNSHESIDAVRERAKLPSGTLAVVDALAIALTEGSRINTVMLGAVTRAAGFIDPQIVRDSISRSFKSKYEHLLKGNLAAFDRGFAETVVKEYPDDGKYEPIEYVRTGPTFGYMTAPIGGLLGWPGSSVGKDLSASRQGIYPVYLRERCIDCGLCTQTCPDYVFVWEKRTDERGISYMALKGPNYQYCKGCLKCVEICPVAALVMACERPEFSFSGNVQLWGPPDALATMGRDNDPAQWEKKDGYYWYRVG